MRLFLIVLATTGFIAGTAAPAMADPAGPTNYESTIVAVEPSSTVATFEVVGGDAFLEVTVALGHTLEVPGYFREPYIRVDADGTVWVNEDSKTLYENEERYGVDELPAGVDGVGEPQWRQVADNGVYAWHDHRVHWMSRDVPPAVAGSTRQLVFPWRVPVTIDGIETIITGDLVWLPSQNAWPMLVIGASIIVVVALLWRWRPSLLGVVAVTMAITAGAVVIAEHLATPAAARGFPVWVVFPAVAAIAAALGAARRSIAGFSPDYLLLLSGLMLATWGFAMSDVLSKPIIPSALPSDLQRILVASIGGAGMAITLLAVIAVLGATDHGESARRTEPEANPT